MKKKPIDIILLTFNRKKILQRTLEMIWARTKTPYRLIVVDNGSGDGTVKFLRTMKARKRIGELIEMKDNPGICAAYNEAFKYIKSYYFVTTQDDILPPNLKPDWIERMISLLRRNKDYGAVAMRVAKMINIKFDPNKEINDAKRACCAYLRISKKSVVAKNDPPFGEKRGNTDDIEFKKLMARFGLKAGFATNIWAHHIGHSQISNKGYGDFTNYIGYSEARNKCKQRKPYPQVNLKTNVPI